MMSLNKSIILINILSYSIIVKSVNIEIRDNIEESYQSEVVGMGKNLE